MKKLIPQIIFSILVIIFSSYFIWDTYLQNKKFQLATFPKITNCLDRISKDPNCQGSNYQFCNKADCELYALEANRESLLSKLQIVIFSFIAILGFYYLGTGIYKLYSKD